MAEVETPVPTVPLTKETEENATKAEVNGGDHNNTEISTEVDNVGKESVNGTSDVTENGESPVDTEVKPAEEVTTVENDGEAVETVTEKKEEPTPKVILHQSPPGKDIPSLSIFCLKLETFLRLNKIPYENQYGIKPGKKGKLPWIEYQGERKTDSSFIIDYLKEKFELQIDQELSDEQNALGRAIKVMLEENSYWGLSYNRYIDNYNEYKRIVAPSSGGGIGFNVGIKMTQRKVRTSLDGHGMGRHSRDEIYEILEKDIMAVSTLLGEKSYLLGDHISSFDCTLFSFVANVLWCGLESPMSTLVKEKASNLVSYAERIKEECWPDWSDMVLGDKPEPQLKKGFSFRKKKAKSAKPQEKEEETADKPTEETADKQTEEATEETATEKEETPEATKSDEKSEKKEDTNEEKPEAESTPDEKESEAANQDTTEPTE